MGAGMDDGDHSCICARLTWNDWNAQTSNLTVGLGHPMLQSRLLTTIYPTSAGFTGPAPYGRTRHGQSLVNLTS